MTRGRWILVVTLLVVAALGFWFAVAKWDDVNRVAVVLSAVAGVAAVGVALWAAVRGFSQDRKISISSTGQANSDDGDANSGMRGKSALPDTPIEIRDTGPAKSRKGNSNTGLDWGQ